MRGSQSAPAPSRARWRGPGASNLFDSFKSWAKEMGNKLTKRRSTVDERYLKPTGLYAHHDVDGRKLKRLILDGKLAPCYPGAEDKTPMVKTPQSSRPAQCPFCKTPGYAVEFPGARTEDECKKEQMEQQRVIEAQIRMRRVRPLRPLGSHPTRRWHAREGM